MRIDFKKWRTENKLTQPKIAKYLGVHLTTVSHWERGLSKPHPDIQEKVLDMMQRPKEIFFPDSVRESDAVNPGGRIKSIREKRGFTIEQISRELGVTTDTVVAWESNKIVPILVMFMELANFLNVPVRYLERGVGGNWGRPKSKKEAEES